ncbi:type I restriction-modification enzyme R subunit C-terminal domain-containing protein [Hymenobacter sp. ASUV-10]|uniref:Type I restriction-modification enzyme R subunit C-terminal domain-containing protein n=1 Tax=Hymenobacter aranciens TaxID=3063996 RepID=A0ABT9BMJ8_9BACT|nr:DEAD/DEAH box helicase family protein [Hymenobacter sp. ASUV-10]MDO7877738.1 type I restriction-modification enzyme R subunit C-terminal domain-containing protein [Hymenobacter sp. ASUV-10]
MLTPEQHARQLIDAQLAAAGWAVQDAKQVNLGAGPGVAVREYPTASGPADYALFVDRKLVGIIEAKKEGTSLTAVAEQTARYQASATKHAQRVAEQLPFGYEANGQEIRFADARDPEPRSRPVFGFHRPETLRDWTRQLHTLRARLRTLPAVNTAGLRDCQIEALRNLDVSLKDDRPRALIQMATGSGKTFTAVSFIYRLIKFAGAKRVLFLVDRGNLGRQTLQEFQQYTAPDDGRKFTELYNVQHLTSNQLDTVSKVTITTIQRLYSMLRGEAEFDAGNEERSGFELNADLPQRPREVAYNPAVPPEGYDFVVIDECHRSIYNVWQQVLEYFDAHLIGLTATPAKQTFGFFNQNLVMEYSHERAVVDGVNVGSDVFRIETEITQRGSRVEKGSAIKRMERQTRKRRWETLDDDLVYSGIQLDRSVTAPDQIRTVLETWKARLFTELFPGREIVPKTLIFAKSDHHADEIVDLVREVFGKSNEFCKKITYAAEEKSDELIKRFRNDFHPRVAVTVDMISTGTDIKPLECLLFLRDVRSRVYFDQMKGRGTRVIAPTDLEQVTADAGAKTRFVIVDAVGVTDSEKRDTESAERQPGALGFEKLLHAVALGNHEPAQLRSLAQRLARLDRQLTPDDRAAVLAATQGTATVQQLAARLYDAVDPVRQEAEALRLATAEAQAAGRPSPAEPDEAHWQQAEQALTERAVHLFDDPALRHLLTKVHAQHDLVIDLVSKDRVLTAGFVGEPTSPAAARVALARQRVGQFEAFIAAHKDEITALQLLHNLPYARRAVSFEQLKQLALALRLDNPQLTPEHLWDAYEQLEKARVRGAGPRTLLTNLVSLVRFALHQTETLTAYPLTVEERFGAWLAKQEQAGRAFTEEQRRWLGMMQEKVATSLSVEAEDFTLPPFVDQGGYARARQVFGADLQALVDELNEALAA